MADPIHLELMHAVLDGEASSEEEARLERLLDDDPDARAQFEELRELHQLLARTPSVEPPSDLTESIASRISLPRSLPGSAAAAPKPRWMRYAAAVAVGFVLGGLVGTTAYYEITGPGETGYDLIGMAGTMASKGDVRLSEANVHELAVAGISGSLSVNQHEELQVLTVAVKETPGATLELALDETLRVVGFAGLDDNQPEMWLAEDRFELRLDKPHRYAIFLRGAEPALPIEIHRDGELIYQAELEVPRPD